jgi:twitching motility protein PilI
MANREALRELQSRLAERLQAARSQQRASSWLAVECAGRGFLLPLGQAGEIFGMAPLVAVPHTHDWFLGVANLRGGLYGVVDLARFLGASAGAAGAVREQARLVVFNPTFDLNCALLVERLAGLRGADQLTLDTDEDQPRPAFVGNRYRDGTGRTWQELNLAALASEDAFIRIVE